MTDADKAVTALVLLFGAQALSIATLINGYGLHIASWGWIVGGFIGQLVLLALISALND